VGVLEGKVALITGAARGQGAADVRLFAQEGAKVVITDVLDDLGQTLAEELGDAVIFQHLDVSKADQWGAAVSAALSTFGRLDILVNNAAIARLNMIENLTEQEYLAHVGVNQLGPWLGMRAARDALKASGGGAIVNVASTAGLQGFGGGTAYVSTKHALVGMTKAAAFEFAPLGVRVNVVCPGGMDTPMNDASVAMAKELGIDPNASFLKLPVGRIGQPEEIGRMVLFLASDAASYCYGGVYIVDGGQTTGFATS
jgi:3alpha(or 20beta)-hydroxysteroid dehydrogenase